MVVHSREVLVDEIVRALESQAVYTARVEVRPLQHVVDIRWAMKTAGRRLGQPVHIGEDLAGDRLTLVATITK